MSTTFIPCDVLATIGNYMKLYEVICMQRVCKNWNYSLIDMASSCAHYIVLLYRGIIYNKNDIIKHVIDTYPDMVATRNDLMITAAIYGDSDTFDLLKNIEIKPCIYSLCTAIQDGHPKFADRILDCVDSGDILILESNYYHCEPILGFFVPMGRSGPRHDATESAFTSACRCGYTALATRMIDQAFNCGYDWQGYDLDEGYKAASYTEGFDGNITWWQDLAHTDIIDYIENMADKMDTEFSGILSEHTKNAVFEKWLNYADNYIGKLYR